MDQPSIASPETLPKPGFVEEALPHLDAVYRFALRLTAGHSDEAEDIVQDTFLRAYRAWESYERGTNCRSWLFTICRNVFLRRRERDGRRPERAMSQFDVPLESISHEGLFEAGESRNPEHDFFDSFVDEEILSAIDGLPDEFREAVTLSDLQGMGYADIADILMVPLGTVKSRIYRGRRMLQERLYNYAVNSGFLRVAHDQGAGDAADREASPGERQHE